MRYYDNNLLTFDRDQNTIGGIHSLFGTLITMNWPETTIFSMTEKKWINVVKEPKDIVKVDFEYSELYNEYIRWTFGHPDKILLPLWSLNKEKTDLFLKSLEACVMYYIPRKDKLFSPQVMDKVLNLYVQIFQKKIPEFN